MPVTLELKREREREIAHEAHIPSECSEIVIFTVLWKIPSTKVFSADVLTNSLKKVPL